MPRFLRFKRCIPAALLFIEAAYKQVHLLMLHLIWMRFRLLTNRTFTLMDDGHVASNWLN